jgi:hypothetical protein
VKVSIAVVLYVGAGAKARFRDRITVPPGPPREVRVRLGPGARHRLLKKTDAISIEATVEE